MFILETMTLILVEKSGDVDTYHTYGESLFVCVRGVLLLERKCALHVWYFVTIRVNVLSYGSLSPCCILVVLQTKASVLLVSLM